MYKTRQSAPRCSHIVACLLLVASLAYSAAMPCAPLVTGMVWQIDATHLDAHGDWNRLGIDELLVQWTAVDNLAFVASTGLAQSRPLPNWSQIGQQPWARHVIVGLAGRFDENEARAQVRLLIDQSVLLARFPPPVHIEGWYFPVELDPSWHDAAMLGGLLGRLPRPLWISVYDKNNIGGQALAEWLASWLPADVGVFFQDGCGVYARTAPVARSYADALSAKLGAGRVRIIAEAFRPAQGGGFRPARAAELVAQLAYYKGYRSYLFDGPHYVSEQMVQTMLTLSGANPSSTPAEHP
jgi:hypothetical protein